jgi:hypothetical protein
MSNEPAAGPVVPVDLSRSLRWAAFLACSWTWCIGLFLPVLLVRDFGVWGFVVFAIPNVIGAAAMGWAFTSRETSMRLTVVHAPATRAFSLVTVAFHVFFAVAFLPELIGLIGAAIVFALMLMLIVPVLMSRLHDATLATILLAFTVVLFAAGAGAGVLSAPPAVPGDVVSILALSAVCALGFIACPYLDLTFHRARQECASIVESRVAFGIGFGVIFLAMILLTLFYSTSLLSPSTAPAARVIVGLHVAAQSLFTVGVHGTALRGSADMSRSRALPVLAASATLVPVVLALASRWLDARDITWAGLGAPEIGYRLFLVFFGLIFPAYAWLCVHPGRGYHAPHPRTRLLTTLVIVVSLPFFYVAFIERMIVWALPAIAIVLAARLLVDAERRDWLAEQRAVMKENPPG